MLSTAYTHRKPCSQRGVVMLEVLVSIVILAIGLLGLAKLQVSSRQLEMESYQRAQAVILLQDMVGRLASNTKAASCYAITDPSTGSPFFGTGAAAPSSCGIGTISQQTTAVNDLTQWQQLLTGAAETDGGSQTGAMIGARGCIAYDSVANLYVVSVAWQGLLESSAPIGLNCASGLYGTEPRRRVVSAVVRIATLS